MQSSTVTIQRLTTVILTVENETLFEGPFLEWIEREGCFLPDRLKTRELFLKAIAVQIERGEAPYF